jgi:hypothetical protein
MLSLLGEAATPPWLIKGFMVVGSSFIARVMLSLAETGRVGMAVATGSGVLIAAVGVGRGVGLAIPGKPTGGEAVSVGRTVGVAVVPQATAARATAAVMQACQCPFSLTKSSYLNRSFPLQVNLLGHTTRWSTWNYKAAS